MQFPPDALPGEVRVCFTWALHVPRARSEGECASGCFLRKFLSRAPVRLPPVAVGVFVSSRRSPRSCGPSRRTRRVGGRLVVLFMFVLRWVCGEALLL